MLLYCRAPYTFREAQGVSFASVGFKTSSETALAKKGIIRGGLSSELSSGLSVPFNRDCIGSNSVYAHWSTSWLGSNPSVDLVFYGLALHTLV